MQLERLIIPSSKHRITNYYKWIGNAVTFNQKYVDQLDALKSYPWDER
jgi:hypothetical protein